jgi:D-amino-acid dehydrogenase
MFRTPAGAAVARHESEFARGQGFTPREVARDELHERQPALSDGVRGAFHYSEGRSMDPYGFVRAVAAQASAAGAEFRSGVEVEAVLTGGGRARGVRTRVGDFEASAVVLATGAYSAELYRRLGFPLPVIPAKGYHLDLANRASPPGADDRPIDALGVSEPCLLVETSVFCTPLPGRLRLAGTLEFSGVNDRIRRQRLEQLRRGARLYLDGLDVPAVTTVSEWCGLRPCTPDGLPAVGALPGWADLYAATGHAMLGLTFGPVTGEILADLLLEGRRSPALTALDPSRFRRGRRIGRARGA